jgi:hypothetical protein
VAAVLAVAAFGGSVPLRVAPAAAATGGCSTTTAVAVATQSHVGVDPTTGRTPVAQVLCGPFFGPGSQGMVVPVAVPTGCGGSTEWAVFRYAAGTWQLVMDRKNGAFLGALGSDIRERVGDPRPGDPPCAPSAWKTRIWHWNGTRFTASPWKSTAGALHLDNFRSPYGKVWCRIIKDVTEDDVWCVSSPPRPEHLAKLKRNGTVTICNGYCTQNWDDSAPVLNYGQRNEVNGFRCTSETKGITCTLIAGAAKGKGFLVNAAGATKVGP